jgi:hypothetical protein
MTTLESTTERLEEALRRLAVEAADLFEELLASGAELPFDLEPTDDGPLPMYSYAPLTGLFIERHLAELRAWRRSWRSARSRARSPRSASWSASGREDRVRDGRRPPPWRDRRRARDDPFRRRRGDPAGR